MNTPFDSDTLAAAEVCFAVASQLLYLEPEIAPVAEQVASRQFASAPFGEGNDDERQGLHLLDGWCGSRPERIRGARGGKRRRSGRASRGKAPHSPKPWLNCAANGCACLSAWARPRRRA